MYFNPKYAEGEWHLVKQKFNNEEYTLINSSVNSYYSKYYQPICGIQKTQRISGNDNRIWLQTGPDTLSGFSLELCDATTKSLGIHDPPIDVSTYENCMDALNRVGDAITKVSSFRSIFGAQQNRLESAYRNNTNTAENTQAAESRIRDTDMADEVVNNAMQEILLQAGQAMISQANQQNQGVLSLLS